MAPAHPTSSDDSSRPRILWLAHDSPVPPVSGGRLRSLSLINGLLQQYDVTVAVLHGDAPPQNAARTGLDFVDLRGRSRRDQIACLPVLVVHAMPPTMRHFAQPRQRAAVKYLLAENAFAAIVADTPYTTGAVPRDSPPLLVNTHNVEREVWTEARAEVTGGRLRLMLDRALVGRWEVGALNAARGVAFCSQRDRDVLLPRLRPDLLSAVVPNAVNTDALQAMPDAEEHSQVLFVGRLSYPPNADAVAFLIDKLAPRLAETGTTVVFVGADGDSGPGYRFAGRVSDLAPFYATSFAVVVPLFSGSGTRLKVLEAMAYGRTVIATTKAVEGLELVAGHDYLPAETADDFVQALSRLQDAGLRQRLTVHARATVEARFSCSTAGAALRRLVEEVTSGNDGLPLDTP